VTPPTAGHRLESDAPTVDRLLDTAAGLFWEKGYAATTTREIAAALHIQQASLYYHVSSKEDLLYQIFVSSLQQFLADVPATVQAAAATDRIHILIRAHVLTLLKYQKRNMTMLTELRSLSSRHRDEVVALRERYADFVRSTIEEAQAAGEIRTDIPAEYLCLALFNMLNWAARWFREDRDPPPDQVAELFFKLYLQGAASSRAHSALPAVKAALPRARRQSKAAEHSTVERLLDAAVALFSRKGYSAASTREVASLLGMQKASLYYHIQSKEDLLYFICKSSLERIRSDVETATHEVSDPLERTHALIVAHVESMLRDKDERLVQIVALREGYVDLVRSVLHDAQKAGALRDDIDVRYLSLGLLGLMNRVLVWYRRRGPLSPSQLGELLAVIFLAGIAPV
jgi:TetR/AcrR family transcriptional regulator, cholesterol catabolism regulator